MWKMKQNTIERRKTRCLPWHEVASAAKKFRDKTLKANRLGLSWIDKGSKLLTDCQAESQKHEFQADYDRRSFQKLKETIESHKEEIHRAQADGRRRQGHQLLHEQLLKQNWHLREAREKSLNEMEELKRFQGSTFDTIARRKLVEDQDTILELTGKIQELQNEINCMNDSRDFQDANQYAVDIPTLPVNLCFSPPHPDPGGVLSRSIGMPSRREGPPNIWDTHGISGNVFANLYASSSAPYPQEWNPWSSSTEEPLHSSTVEKSEWRTQDQDQRCQSGQSAKDSVIQVEIKEESSTVRMLQEQLFISELFRDIQDAILLIRHCRTMW